MSCVWEQMCNLGGTPPVCCVAFSFFWELRYFSTHDPSTARTPAITDNTSSSAKPAQPHKISCYTWNIAVGRHLIFHWNKQRDILPTHHITYYQPRCVTCHFKHLRKVRKTRSRSFSHHSLCFYKSFGDDRSPLESLALQIVGYRCHDSTKVFYESG